MRVRLPTVSGDHKDRQALLDACVKKVQENYTEEVVAKKYLELYKSII